MNFLELTQHVCLFQDILPVPTTLANPTPKIQRVMACVNQAYQHVWLAIGNRNEGAETEVTLTLPALTDRVAVSLLQVTQVVSGDNEVIPMLPWREFEALHKRSGDFFREALLDPTVCAFYGGRLYFYPTPTNNKTLLVRGKSGFTLLSADTDEPAFNSSYHLPVSLFALYKHAAYAGDPNAEQFNRDAQVSLEAAMGTMRHHADVPRILDEDEAMTDYNWWELEANG